MRKMNLVFIVCGKDIIMMESENIISKAKLSLNIVHGERQF